VIEYLDSAAEENKDLKATLGKIRSYQQTHGAGESLEATQAKSA
jgi:hypothetical protein